MNQPAVVDRPVSISKKYLKVTVYLTKSELRDMKVAAAKMETGIAFLGNQIITDWLYGSPEMEVADEPEPDQS